MSKQEYEAIIRNCMAIAIKVYSLHREENNFLSGSLFEKSARLVWLFIFATFIAILFSEVFESTI
jgi:hypothetical protein